MLEQLTILSPGLLGGSVGRAARERGVAQRIVVWARRPETRSALKAQPWCDLAADSAETAVRGAQLVVVAAPVDVIVPLVRQIAPHLPDGAVVTDVGSVKGRIAREGHAAVGARARFVGAHPMAGSEKTGWEHGTASLFEGRTCFVTPLPETDAKAALAAADFWSGLGARVVRVSPEAHDEIVAHISHLPQVVASALCSYLAGRDVAWRGFAGGGLRDTTRIARSDPALWRTILQDNRREVLSALQGFQKELAAAEKALAAGDWDGVAALLTRGKTYRDGLK